MTQWVLCINNVLWHTVRNDDGTDGASWQGAWGDVMGQVTSPSLGAIIDVDCDVDTYRNLQLVVRTSTDIWHTFRNPSGNWQTSWGNVLAPAAAGPLPLPSGVTVKLMTCGAGADGTFQIMLVLSNNTILHTVRNANTSWQKGWGTVNPNPTGLPKVAPQLLAGG